MTKRASRKKVVDKETHREKLIRIDVKTCYIGKAVDSHTKELKGLRDDLSEWQKGMVKDVNAISTDLAVHKTKYNSDRNWIAGIFFVIYGTVGAMLKKLFLG